MCLKAELPDDAEHSTFQGYNNKNHLTQPKIIQPLKSLTHNSYQNQWTVKCWQNAQLDLRLDSNHSCKVWIKWPLGKL